MAGIALRVRVRSQIHWFSILNSLAIVLLLTGIVAMIMMRTCAHARTHAHTRAHARTRTHTHTHATTHTTRHTT
jgi:hypothetical protein